MSVELAKDPELVAKIKQEIYHLINELELSLSVTDHAKIAIGNFNEVELEELLKKFHDNLSEVQGDIKDEENKKRIRRLQSLIANISMRLNQILANKNSNIVKPVDQSAKSTSVNTNPSNIANRITPTVNNIRNFVNNIINKIAPSASEEIITEQVKGQMAKAEAGNYEVKDDIPVTQTEIQPNLEQQIKQELTDNSIIDEVVRNLIEAIGKIIKGKPIVRSNQHYQTQSNHSNGKEGSHSVRNNIEQGRVEPRPCDGPCGKDLLPYR